VSAEQWRICRSKKRKGWASPGFRRVVALQVSLSLIPSGLALRPAFQTTDACVLRPRRLRLLICRFAANGPGALRPALPCFSPRSPAVPVPADWRRVLKATVPSGQGAGRAAALASSPVRCSPSAALRMRPPVPPIQHPTHSVLLSHEHATNRQPRLRKAVCYGKKRWWEFVIIWMKGN